MSSTNSVHQFLILQTYLKYSKRSSPKILDYRSGAFTFSPFLQCHVHVESGFYKIVKIVFRFIAILCSLVLAPYRLYLHISKKSIMASHKTLNFVCF